MNAFCRALNISTDFYQRLLDGSVESQHQRKPLTSAEVLLADYLDPETGSDTLLCGTFRMFRSHVIPTTIERTAREAAARKPACDREIAMRREGATDPQITFDDVKQHHERALKAHKTKREAERGITMAEAAHRCGLCSSAYRDIELGRVLPHECTIERLTKLFQHDLNLMRSYLKMHAHFHAMPHQDSCRVHLKRQRQRICMKK